MEKFNSTLEEWRPIKQAPGYEVSNMGRVRSVPRAVKTSNGRVCHYAGTTLRAAASTKLGHQKVFVGSKERRRACFVHALVLDAFVGPCPRGRERAHGDGNPRNNRLGNLRYATPKANSADKLLHGTHLARARHPAARLTEGDIRQIKRLRRRGCTQHEVANLMGVCRTTISAIDTGRSWAGEVAV